MSHAPARLSRSAVLLSSSLILLPTVALFAVALFSLAAVDPVQAESWDSARGRLPNGKAFRTDQEGNQLVDYIAELEVNVESLKTQVGGLEDEVKEKQGTIDRLREDGKREAEVREKNLLATQPSAPAKTSQVAVVTCDTERSKIQELSNSLELTKADLEVERQVSLKRVADTQSSASDLQAKLTSQTGDLENLRTEMTVLQQREAKSSAEVARLRREIGGLQLAAEHSAQERRSRTPVITSASLVARPADRGVESRSLGETGESATAALAQSSTGASASTVAASQGSGDARASLSIMRMRAVEVVRGKVRTELSQVRGTIASRDELFRKYSSQKRAVAFTPSRPVSESGLTLSDISKRLQSASTVGELSVLNRDVSRIEQKMNEDISLMRRMERVK